MSTDAGLQDDSLPFSHQCFSYLADESMIFLKDRGLAFTSVPHIAPTISVSPLAKETPLLLNGVTFMGSVAITFLLT